MRILVPLIAFITGLVVGAGALFYASDQHSTSGLTGSGSSSGSEWYSYIAGKRLVALASSADLAASPRWVSGDPLPLRPEDAISRAQESLKRLGSPAADWVFAEITVSEGKRHEFLYTVLFQPSAPPVDIRTALDGVRLLVYFNGSVTLPVSTNGSAP